MVPRAVASSSQPLNSAAEATVVAEIRAVVHGAVAGAREGERDRTEEPGGRRRHPEWRTVVGDHLVELLPVYRELPLTLPVRLLLFSIDVTGLEKAY